MEHLAQISEHAAKKRKQRRVEPPVKPNYELARVSCSGKLAVRSIPRSRDSKAITLFTLPKDTEVRLTCKMVSTDSPEWFAEIHPHHDSRNLWKDFDVGFVPYDSISLVQVTDQRASELSRKISTALTNGMSSGVKVSNYEVLEGIENIGGLFAKYVRWGARLCGSIVAFFCA